MTGSDAVTPATRAAARLGLDHDVRVVGPARDAEDAAARLAIAPDRLLKTLVVRRTEGDYLFVLLPGPRQIHWPRLRRHLGVSRLSLPDAQVAFEVTGYERGTITPLGAHHPWPVVADTSVVGAGRVSIGGGARGVAILVDADALLAALSAATVELTAS